MKRGVFELRHYLLTLSVFALAAGTAEGQISLLPGPQRLVSFAPKFIVAGFFNADGFADVAVSNSASNEITVVLGQDGSSFGRAVVVDAGRTLRGLRAGDINNDGQTDLAVVDFIDGKVFTVTGNGDGSFNTPNNYKVAASPVDVVIGNFDRGTGNDVVVVSQDTITIVSRAPRNDLEINPSAAIDGTAKRAAAADLNGDAFDDIVVVTSGTAEGDHVAVFLNNTYGGFVAASDLVVGPGPVGVVIADFDNDGAADLAVLNAGSGDLAAAFTASILLNQPVEGRGTGSFTAVSPIQLHCPATIGGIPVVCRPNGIAAGDFNHDGNMDLAVTWFTQPQDSDSSTQTSGLVLAYQGDGTGAFDLAEEVVVGIDPQGIIAGDFNGDGITDLAIAEQGSRSVRIITSLLGNGHPCQLDQQCASDHCTDGVCCTDARCPAGHSCNIPTLEGTCDMPFAAPSCIVDGQCQPPTSDDATGYCTDGVCCGVRACPAGQSCGIPPREGLCTNLPMPTSTITVVPTATFIPPPPTLTPTTPSHSDTGEGCNVTQPSADYLGLPALLLWLVPLLLRRRSRSQCDGPGRPSE